MRAGESPSAAPPRAVIFDIGGVIVRVNVSRALAALQHGTGFSAEQIWTAIQVDPLWNDWETGKIEPREWHRHLARKLDSPIDFEAFSEAWCRVLEPDPIIGDGLFRELRARARLGLISNTDPLHVAYMEKNLSFMRYFPVRVYSCRVGICKPAPGIYLRALQEIGVAAGETLYVDDIEENVQAAREIGMLGVRFTGLATLRSELRRYALLGG
ncbi:MAG: HAD family phosphatase [Candidatus Acidiferrales bacterium]